MLNSSQIRLKLEQGPTLKAIFESGRKPKEIVEELYLTILSRQPTADEVKTALEYVAIGPASKPGTMDQSVGAGKLGDKGKSVASGKSDVARKPGAANKPRAVNKPGTGGGMKKRDDWLDIAWALVNSAEFLYRH
jgi:hypothetical protein